MARYGSQIRYRHNPPILGKRPLGPKVQDAVTGFWYYQAYQTTNLYGELVDCRGEGMDTRESKEDVQTGS